MPVDGIVLDVLVAEKRLEKLIGVEGCHFRRIQSSAK
jgi:hypothetical protein